MWLAAGIDCAVWKNRAGNTTFFPIRVNASSTRAFGPASAYPPSSTTTATPFCSNPGFPPTVAAVSLTKIIQLIGHDVTDKVRRDRGGWDDGRTAL